jgi:hypothetical protein
VGAGSSASASSKNGGLEGADFLAGLGSSAGSSSWNAGGVGGVLRAGGAGLLHSGGAAGVSSVGTTKVALHFEHFILRPRADAGTFSLAWQLSQATTNVVGAAGEGVFGAGGDSLASWALKTLPQGHLTDLPIEVGAIFSLR